MTISEDEFWNEYVPRDSPDGNGQLWPFHLVLAEPNDHVWTVVESDDGEDMIAAPGYHIVNVIDYVVTEKPWADLTLDAYFYKHDT